MCIDYEKISEFDNELEKLKEDKTRTLRRVRVFSCCLTIGGGQRETVVRLPSVLPVATVAPSQETCQESAPTVMA